MFKLDVVYERIAETPKGPIVALVFRGTYRPGSAGNEFAQEMISFLNSVLADENPAAVMFDLTALDYVWGDGIARLAMPLLDKSSRSRPAAIVAIGGTAVAIKPLLQPGWLPSLAGMRLFDSRREAVAYLQRAILGNGRP
jgi:hypothetical protein